MPQKIEDWQADYTGADTNLPTEGQSPTVGPELREIKAVIRGETLNKHFRSDKINAFHAVIDPDDTIRVDATDLGAEWPTDADILPGETLLVTLNDPDAFEYWAVVKTVTLAPGEVILTLFTGVHLDGTDGTVSHIRRSIYKVPNHPSHPIDPAYEENMKQVSALPARFSTMFGRMTGAATTLKVGFPFKIPTAYNVRIFCTVKTFVSGGGAVPIGALLPKSITRDELEATLTVHTAPGGTSRVEWLFTVYIE